MSTANGTGEPAETTAVGVAGEPEGSEESTAKLVRAVRLLRLVTWSVFSLAVAALLVVTVVGPFLLGNPTVTGGRPVLFGGLLLSLVAGTVAFVAAALTLD